jgi:hypothetical protein
VFRDIAKGLEGDFALDYVSKAMYRNEHIETQSNIAGTRLPTGRKGA